MTQPPPSAAKMVQNYVWRLRSVAGRGRRRGDRHARARRMSCGSTASSWTSAASSGWSPRRRGRPRRASRRARRARRWRCFAAIRSRTSPTSRSPTPRSAGSRSCGSTAAELAIEADLAAGRHHEVVGEIDALLAENPLRERLHAQRMLALYRCGRQAEALEAYRQARAHAGRGDRRRAVAPSSGACTTRSCARTRRWTSSRRPPSSRASSTRRRRRR